MTAASLAPWQATICQSQPPLQIIAGSIVSSQLECSPDQNMHCEAVLQFKDHTFLPYVVDLAGNRRCSTDHTCVGEFIVPASVPNGPATLFWLCAGQMAPACVEAEIQAGNGDVSTLRGTSTGTLVCMPRPPSQSTGTSTASTSHAASSGTSLPTPTNLKRTPIDRVRRHNDAARQSLEQRI